MTVKHVSFFRSIRSTLLFLCGVFATMPILTFKGRTLFNIVFILTIGVLSLSVSGIKKLFVVRGIKRYLFFWLCWALVSAVVGLWVSMKHPELGPPIIPYIPKLILYILFFLLCNAQGKDVIGNSSLIIRGVFAGCVLNLVWGIMDAACYYLLGFSINNDLFFKNYRVLGSFSGRGATLILNTGQIRAAGFNYDPAQFGFMCPFVAFYALKRRSILLYALAIAGILASSSTTAVVGVFAVTLYHLASGKLQGKTTKLLKRDAIMIATVLVIGVGALYIYSKQISSFVYRAGALFYERVSFVYFNEEVEDLRWLFVRYLPDAMMRLGPLMLTGLGLGTAFFGYSHNAEVAHLFHNPPYYDKPPLAVYDMENTYIAYLMDLGVVGLGLFVFFMMGILRALKRRGKEIQLGHIDTVIYCGIIATMISFLFYHFILFSVHLLIQISATLIIDKREKTEFKMAPNPVNGNSTDKRL